VARAAAGEVASTRGGSQAAAGGAQLPRARARTLPAWRDEPLVWGGAQAALLVGAVALQASQPLNHDVGWLLVGTRRLLTGASLYRDGFVDVNPPAVLALFAPAVAFARALGLSEILALRLWVFALCAGSLLLCRRLLLQLFASESPVLVRACGLVLSFVVLVLPHRDFGQREHLIVLLLLPYLIDACVRERGGSVSRRLALAIGAGAGLAVAMKPHYALAVAAAELFVAGRRRSWRASAGAELAGFGAAVAGAALAIAALHPDYYRVALPLARETYGAYQSSLASLVRARDLALLACALLAAALVSRGGAARALALLLVGASLAGWIAYLIGGTWWDYHRHPFRAFAIAAVGVGAAQLLARPSAAPRPAASRAGGLAAAACAFALTLGLLLAAPLRIGATLREADVWRSGAPAGAAGEITEVTLRRGRGGAIWLPASSVDPAFPAVNYAGVEWASRLSCLWPLPAVIQARSGRAPDTDPGRLARLDTISRTLVAMVVEDLERAQPELIFISRVRENLGLSGLGFDFLAFFERKPRFARLWSQYAWVEDTPSFRVYARKSQPARAALANGARAALVTSVR
jgi:hypothetical protein